MSTAPLTGHPQAPYQFNESGWPTEEEMDRHHNDKHSSAPPKYECLWKSKGCSYWSQRKSNCKQHMEKKHQWTYGIPTYELHFPSTREEYQVKLDAASDSRPPTKTPQTKAGAPMVIPCLSGNAGQEDRKRSPEATGGRTTHRTPENDFGFSPKANKRILLLSDMFVFNDSWDKTINYVVCYGREDIGLLVCVIGLLVVLTHVLPLIIDGLKMVLICLSVLLGVVAGLVHFSAEDVRLGG